MTKGKGSADGARRDHSAGNDPARSRGPLNGRYFTERDVAEAARRAREAAERRLAR